MVAVANWAADNPPRRGMSRPALMAWLTRSSSPVFETALSGRAQACVADGDVTEVTVGLTAEPVTVPVMRITATLPDAYMPPYPYATRSDTSSAVRRFVVEAVMTGTVEAVVRTDTVARVAAGGSVGIDIPLDEGTYDVRLWSDCCTSDGGLQSCYDASDLRQVRLSGTPYSAGTAGKDAACGVINAVTVTTEGARAAAVLECPLAGYRLVATDADRYCSAGDRPPLSDLTVTVACEGFFPSSFNVVTGSVNDAVSGLSYTCGITGGVGADGSMSVAADMLFAGNADNSIRLTVTVRDSAGNIVSRRSHIDVPYRRGCMTTVSGEFLTAGRGDGGVGLDTGWAGDTFVVGF